MMMKTEYENTINTIDDVLQSDRKFLVLDHSYQKSLLKIDPREKVQLLEAEYFKFDNFRVPEWTNEG